VPDTTQGNVSILVDEKDLNYAITRQTSTETEHIRTWTYLKLL